MENQNKEQSTFNEFKQLGLDVGIGVFRERLRLTRILRGLELTVYSLVSFMFGFGVGTLFA